MASSIPREGAGRARYDCSAEADALRRHRIFHGLNMVYKVPPYYPRSDDFDPQLSVAAEDIKNIQEWGFTMARVGMMWPGGEPTRGVYNETYFDEIEDLVNRLGEAGIYSLLDVHQDLFSRFYCGEGAEHSWST